MKISVCLNYWGIGGAENQWRRIFEKTPDPPSCTQVHCSTIDLQSGKI